MSAQNHLRLYTCALANDDPSAFMGGSSTGAGLWTSDDSGSTWKHVGWSHVKCYSVAVVDSSFGRTLYLGCGNGCMRSTDAGAHWRMLTDWKVAEVMDVAIDQADPEKISIATSTGMWSSTDRGEHWSESGPREFQSHLYYDRDHRVVPNIVADVLNNETQLVLTNDGGLFANGKQVVRQYSQRGPLWSVAYSDSNIFISGERGIYEYDSSRVLHLITGSPRNIHSMITIGNKMYAVSLSGGVWVCDLYGSKRFFLRSGLDSLQLWSIRSATVK
ncbi:MAG TPA: hypothetical protein VEW28_04830 [Candidatus Kapabacteria bacterium]|nr:hypothetical protein [Candidatus Kapabacteria bacterium]